MPSAWQVLDMFCHPSLVKRLEFEIGKNPFYQLLYIENRLFVKFCLRCRYRFHVTSLDKKGGKLKKSSDNMFIFSYPSKISCQNFNFKSRDKFRDMFLRHYPTHTMGTRKRGWGADLKKSFPYMVLYSDFLHLIKFYYRSNDMF